MPLPPARLRTPREGIEKRRLEMQERILEMRERFVEPLLSRFPRILPTKPDTAARYALYSAIAWFTLWMLFAATVAAKLIWPKLFHQYGFLSYGRLQQVQSNLLSWGVLLMGGVGAAFAIVPRVLGTKLWSERIAAQTVMLLDTVVLAGTVLLMIGRTQGIEGLEWPWPVDLALVAGMLGVLQILIFTLLRRSERQLNAPAKFLLAAFHILPITYAVANFATPYMYGVRQTFYAGFGHAGFLLSMSLIGVGSTMFVLPRATGRPLWSGPMANMTFWLMLLVMPWIGLAQRVLGPTQDWTETLGISMAIAALVPALFLVTLVVKTVRGGLRTDPAVTFMVGASMIWAVAVLLHMIGVLRHPAGVLATTWWDDAVRNAFAGAFGLWLVGLTYHLIPRIRGRALRKPSLVRTHFWVGALGVTIATLASAVAGFVQGYVLRTAVASGGSAAGKGWMLVTSSVQPLLMVRFLAGGLVFAGVVLLLVNVQRTLADGDEIEIEPVVLPSLGAVPAVSSGIVRSGV